MSGGESPPRVVAVTGAGRGLGLLTVADLLDGGATVIAHHRSPSDQLWELAGAHPGRVHLVKGDIGEESTATAIAATAADLGRLDALVHNAALTHDRPLIQQPVAEWDEVHRVNLRGAFLTTKHALRLMIRQRSGRLVYISSVAARTGNPGQAAYAAAKAGLSGLALTVAQEYGSRGVRTVVVSPGLIDTGMGDLVPPRWRQRVADRSLVGVGRAVDVAATIGFLTTPAASFINATTIEVDGGVKYP